MNPIHETVEALSLQFADAVMKAVREMTLSAVHATMGTADKSATATKASAKSAPKTKRGGKRIRRGADEIAAVVASVVATIKKSGKNGIRAENIRAALGIAHKDLMKPIADALRQKLISKRGRRRATTYFAGSAKSVKAAPAKTTKKTKSSKKTKKATKISKKTPKKASKKAKQNNVSAAPKTVNHVTGSTKAADPSHPSP